MSGPDEFDSIFAEVPGDAPDGESDGGGGVDGFDESLIAPAVDIDLSFIGSMVHGGRAAIRSATERGLKVTMLSPEAKAAFEFITGYLADYGEVPTVEMVAAKVALAIPAEPPAGPPAFWIGEVLNRALHGELQAGMDRWAGLMEKRKPADAFEELSVWVREKSAEFSPVTVSPMFSHTEAVKTRYLRRKAGETGILTPWPTVNDLTTGLNPESVWLVVARSGIGKTWAAVLMAYHAWKLNHRVLFATTEMSQEDITQRFVALHFRLDYTAFTRGKLSPDAEKEFLEGCEEISADNRLLVMGGDFDFQPSSYEAAIESCDPALSILDGAYLLKMPGTSRTEQASAAFNEIKRIGKRKRLPQIITSQLNRGAKATDAKSAEQEHVALADAAVWNASVVMAWAQTKDMRADRVAQAKLLKNREGPMGDPIDMTWDFEAMDFTEKPREGGGDADEFGTGFTPATAEGIDSFGPQGEPGSPPTMPF